MRIIKGFNKMKPEEKIEALVKRLQAIHNEEKEVRSALASLRGGQKVEFKEVERPDEALLKA